jgi:hypothetical protein
MTSGPDLSLSGHVLAKNIKYIKFFFLNKTNGTKEDFAKKDLQERKEYGYV